MQGYGLGVLEQAESQGSVGGHGGTHMQELAQNFVDGHEDGIENVHYASFCVSTYLERGMGPAVEDHIIHTFSTSGDCSATVTYAPRSEL